MSKKEVFPNTLFDFNLYQKMKVEFCKFGFMEKI